MNKTQDEVVYEVSYKRKQNARRLSKIHKLKQENRVICDRRKSCYKEAKAWFSKQGGEYYLELIEDTLKEDTK